LREAAVVTLRVVGAGWGRTGTLSTKLALDHLGFGPCYHMSEVFWTHPEHRRTWIAAARGDAVDWDGLYAGYRAAVDWPTCAFWRELTAAYPDAKVILTERDPERWYESYEATIRAGMPPVDREEPPDRDDDSVAAMMRTVIVERSFGGRLEPKAHLLDRYRRHVDEVTSTVPADRLLVWSVAEGWGPLCDFLGVAPPGEPFPRVNSRAEFGRIFTRENDALPDL
jgi:hypothetical protein